MIKKLGVLITAYLLVAGVFTGCVRQNPQDIAADFAEMLDSATTTNDIYEAESFLFENQRYLNEEQTGELLLHWEDQALRIDNTSVDYTDIISKYEGSIPDYLQELFEFKNLEQNSPIVSGAALLVSWDELLNRTTKIENYITANLEHDLIKEDTLWLYRRYLNALLMGASNTPVFDYKTTEYSDELRLKFDAYIANYPDTVTSQIISEYTEYLESIGYSLDYEDNSESKKFFETCSRLVSKAEERVTSPGKGSS